jgi:murein DD-endopeptidase MepM/ murein hydrolase activator NlpD
MGQRIKAGDEIGLVGMTGMTSGPHLHFEVRIKSEEDDRIQNPELWLLPPVGYGVLAGRVTNDYGTLLGSKEIWLKSLDTGKTWKIVTYAPKLFEKKNANDTFYKENYALYDLPQGKYEISTWYYYKYYTQTIEIIPGAINYVRFYGSRGFLQVSPLQETSTSFLN